MNDILSRFGTIAKGLDANNILRDGDDTAIVMDSENTLGAKAKSDCFSRHMIFVTDATQRSIDENNRARTSFYNAVASLFTPRFASLQQQGDKSYKQVVNVGRPNIPESVLKELEMGNFKLDENGKATSGKPLTARRVKRVLDAIAKVMPDIVSVAAKTQTLQKDIIGLGGMAEALPPDSNERTMLVSLIKVDIGHELNEFLAEHNLRGNDQAEHYRQACRNRLDALTQAIIHSGDVKVGEWSKAAITRAIREELAKIKVPVDVKRATEARPFKVNTPLTDQERGVRPSSLVKTVGNYPGLLAGDEVDVSRLSAFTKKFFVRHAAEFRDFVNSLPGGNTLSPSELDSRLDAAMNKFMTFISNKKDADRNVRMVDFMRLFGVRDRNAQMPQNFAERDDIAAGLFKDALAQVFDNVDDRNELKGETANLFKGHSFTSVVRSPMPPAPQAVEQPVNEIRVEAEQPKPVPVKSCQQILAGLLAPTGELSVEQIVKNKVPNGLEDRQVDGLLMFAKNFAEQEISKLLTTFPDPLTKEQQDDLEVHASKLAVTIETALFDTINEDYFGKDGNPQEPLGGKLFNRLVIETKKEACDCAKSKALSSRLADSFKANFATKLSEKLAAKGKHLNLPVSADELGKKAAETMVQQINALLLGVTAKCEGRPKSLVDAIEEKAVAEIAPRVDRAVDVMAERVATWSEMYTTGSWSSMVVAHALSAWVDTAN